MKTTINNIIKQVAMTLLKEGDLTTLRELHKKLQTCVRYAHGEKPWARMSLCGDADWKLASMFDAMTGWNNNGYGFKMYAKGGAE